MKNRRILHGRVFVMQNRDSDLRQSYLTAHKQNSTCLAYVTKQAQAHSDEIFNRLRALERVTRSGGGVPLHLASSDLVLHRVKDSRVAIVEKIKAVLLSTKRLEKLGS